MRQRWLRVQVEAFVRCHCWIDRLQYTHMVGGLESIDWGVTFLWLITVLNLSYLLYYLLFVFGRLYAQSMCIECGGPSKLPVVDGKHGVDHPAIKI